LNQESRATTVPAARCDLERMDLKQTDIQDLAKPMKHQKGQW
jgi:hypothetical protein